MYSCTCQAQNQEIIYQFPAIVINHIQDYLSKEAKNGEYYYGEIDTKGDTVEFFMEKFTIYPELDTFSLFQLVKSSNRYLQLETQKLPLIFFDDILFSNLINRKIDENTYQQLIIGGSGGLYIRFIGKPWTSSQILDVEY